MTSAEKISLFIEQSKLNEANAKKLVEIVGEIIAESYQAGYEAAEDIAAELAGGEDI